MKAARGAAGLRVLVLGASGHIGNAITRELLAQGWRVTAASRQARPEALAGLAVAPVQGDADAPGQLAAWVPGHDAVVDAAAPYPLHRFAAHFADRSAAERAPLDHARRRTEALLDAVARSGAALAHVSSYTTLPRPAGEVALAALQARARRRMHPYFAVKAAMQAQVMAAARTGVRALVFNPSACLGPWDRKPRDWCALPLLVSGQVPALLSHTLNMIDVRDLACAVQAGLARLLAGSVPPAWLGSGIALAGHNCRSDRLAARVCALAGAAAPTLRVPAPLALGGLWCTEAAWALLGRPSPLPTIGPLLLLDGYAMAPGEAQAALGALPRPLDDTLRDAIAWYRRIGYC